MDKFSMPQDVKSIFDLSGKIALITGAGAGLGAAMAWGMACFGANVIVADIDEQRAQAVAREISDSLDRETMAIPVDVSKEPQVRHMVKTVLEQFGKIDIAVNNPGINCRKPILELSLQEFDQVIDINLRGMFLCAREIGRSMVQNGRGKMINMASIFGLVAMPNQTAYASSKGAIIQLTKVLALEWAPYNVQVNALAPAHHKTQLARQLMTKPEIYGDILNRIPQRRFAEAEEIIGPSIFLASKASDFVTGTVLVVDGGWTAQ
jgi:gluconate 5-dehydrogenase